MTVFYKRFRRYAYSVRSKYLRKVGPQCNTEVHVKRSVCDCGHAFASKKRKAWCTAVGEPENTMKCRKALLSEKELVRKEVSKRASETLEQTLHRQEQNQTHMASMRAFEQTLNRQQQDRVST